MTDKVDKPAASDAAGAKSANPFSDSAQAAKEAATKGAKNEGNPALRMMFMGLPRPRLPSRNWMIFLSVTGGFFGTVAYDKYQTRRIKQKWCDAVSHLADEPLPTHQMQRKLTIYLSAPPGDGLRSAREHFHAYIKPILVAAAMDWDVVEGRREGDVRWKTAERIRRKRRRMGEGDGKGLEGEDGEVDAVALVEAVRKGSGTEEWGGMGGDLVVGRHAWKEYVRGVQEGWLGPVEKPREAEAVVEGEKGPEREAGGSVVGQHGALGDADVSAAVTAATPTPSSTETTSAASEFANDDASPQTTSTTPTEEDQQTPPPPAEEKPAEEPPKPRNPPPYLTPENFPSASLSPNAPEILGPSTGIRFPHILGFRNTPIRTYRFLTRRNLAEDIGRQVASAVFAAHEPYGTVTATSAESESGEERKQQVPEQKEILGFEESSWWKSVYEPRKATDEGVWLEAVALDERISGRMRKFVLRGEDGERAERIGKGEVVVEKRLRPGEPRVEPMEEV